MLLVSYIIFLIVSLIVGSMLGGIYLAVAIVLHETGCKWTCSKLVRECNNVGGMKGSGCGSYGYEGIQRKTGICYVRLYENVGKA
mgnify:CR=1 FL=1